MEDGQEVYSVYQGNRFWTVVAYPGNKLVYIRFKCDCGAEISTRFDIVRWAVDSNVYCVVCKKTWEIPHNVKTVAVQTDEAVRDGG